ncbi:MAG: hypothetical protein ACI8UO_004485 [Verrucomicrobiales bacterium]|jgi:hypothetical protein
MTRLLLISCVLGFLAGRTAQAQEDVPNSFLTFFDNYCIDCHDPDTAKGDFSVDFLRISRTPEDAEYWQLLLDNLHLGEMPPEDKKQPALAELEPVIAWVEGELARAARALRGHTGEVVLRRLNRTEFEYTIEDLFDVRGDFADGFPADAEVDGFDNIGAALSLSAEQLDQYLAAADSILTRAIQTEPRPETKKVEFTLHDYNREAWKRYRENMEKRRLEFDQQTPTEQDRSREELAAYEKNPNLGYNFLAWENGKLREPKPEDGPEVGAIIPFRASYAAPDTRQRFRVRQAGAYRLKISVFAAANGDQPVRLKIMSGSLQPSTIPDVVDVIYLTSSEPKDFEYRVYLQPGNAIKFEMLDGTNWSRRDQLVDLPGPFAGVQQIEMEGPLIDEWPPRGHQLLLGKREAEEVTDSEIPQILAELAPKLFRRPVNSEVTQEFIEFHMGTREAGEQPLDAYKITAKAMMASPHFLYHVEYGDEPDGYALANRLSYFLWRSAPDAELLELANSNRLTKPEVLRAQVDRLLADAKSERFLEDFTGQWLGIDLVGEMQPDSNLYPEYDNELELGMVAETRAFVREMLHKDLSLTNFLDSDWAMLNERMAKHYGIPDVTGNEFRRVSLDRAESARGGLLTHASILNITSNGTVTSPVVRGTWILENLLGSPAPPPPPDVPAIEPDIRGASTIKEQLAKHREIAQCGSCHAKIDPYGMALENFDVIGAWRETYRALEPTANPNRPKLVDGQAVDSSDELPRQGAFADFNGFRQLLAAKGDLVSENVAHKLATFALGRTMDFADEATLREVVATTQAKAGGMKTMIRELVASELFARP